jgi:integrase/recombinase XerD
MKSPMRGQVAHFLDHIAYERGLAAHTRAAYETDLAAFIASLQAQGGVLSFSQVTRDHIAVFLAAQRRMRMSSATLARRLVVIKVFFAFLCAEGHITENVTEVMSSPAKGRVLPRTLSEEQIERLLASVSGVRPHEVRDRCMLELFYACGMRVSEVTSLRVNDVRLGDGVVRCIGKGDKQRVIPLGGEARRWLEVYLAQARPVFVRGCETEQALFLTQRGTSFTRQGIFDMLVKRARAAQLGEKISPHVLRHCFASHLLAHGAHIRAIQELLGHADIATTQVYTHVDAGQATRTHALFHPRHTSVRPVS